MPQKIITVRPDEVLPLGAVDPSQVSPAVGTPEFNQNLVKARTQANLAQPGEMQRADANAADPFSQAQLPGESWGGATTRQVIGSGVNAVKGVGSLFGAPKDAGEAAMAFTNPVGLVAKRSVVDPSVDQWQHGATKLGALPIVGPMAAHMGSAAGSGNYGGAAVDALSMAPMVAGAAGAGSAAFNASRAARLGKFPLEAVNHAIKPKNAVATASSWEEAGPYLKQMERQVSPTPVTDAEIPAAGLSKLIDETLRDNPQSIGAQTQAAIAPHAGVSIDASKVGASIMRQVTRRMKNISPEEAAMVKERAFNYLTGPDKTLTIGEAESYVKEINADLQKFYSGDAETQAAITKTKGSAAVLKAEADGIRDAMYDKLNQLGVKDAQRMKKVYGSLRDIEDDVEAAHNRELLKNPAGGGIGPLSEVSGKVGGVLKEAAASSLGKNPITGVPLEAATNTWDWMHQRGTPEAILHRAWSSYEPPPPAPFVTQGPMSGPMSRLLPPGPHQMPPANIMPGNTGTPQPAQPLAPLSRQLPPGPPGQGRMTVLPPGPIQSPGGGLSASPMGGGGASLGSGPFPTPDMAGPPAQFNPGTHMPVAPPLAPGAFQALEDLPHDTLHQALMSKSMDYNRLKAVQRYLEVEDLGKDFPRLREAVNGIIGSWGAIKGMR